MLSFTSADHRSHHIYHSGIDKFRVVITQTPIPEFCHYSRIFNRFAAFSSIPEPEGASGFWCGSWKYSTIPPTDKIRVLTSIHQIYEKFSGNDKIRVFMSMHQIDSKFSPTDKIRVMQEMYGKFSELSRIRMWIPEVRLFWHVSSFRKDIQRFVWPVAACQQMPFYDLTLELYEGIRSLNSIKCLLPIEKYSSHIYQMTTESSFWHRLIRNFSKVNTIYNKKYLTWISSNPFFP